MIKVLTVVGARPQFIKAAAVSRALRAAGHTEILVHTGQHYDGNMSAVFFEELGIPQPDFNLGVGSGLHGAQTGAMLGHLEQILVEQMPHWVLVYGDTNSTLAGALAAAKLNINIAHVEAGLRSFNRSMPEEVNRVVADHLSTLLLSPSQTAIQNLISEGIRRGVHLVGDVMAEALDSAAAKAKQRSRILEAIGVGKGEYVLATVHRAENTDKPEKLRNIMKAMIDLRRHVVFPMHPRTRKVIAGLGYSFGADQSDGMLHFTDPVGYLDMVMLEQSARVILTDSGGVQKEAYWLGVPCVTLREETEWVETVALGWNTLVGTVPERIVEAVDRARAPGTRTDEYRVKGAAAHCVRLLTDSVPS